MDINKELKESKDYQLESLIDQFERFIEESVTNTSVRILNHTRYLAIKELDRRKEKKMKKVIFLWQ